MVRHIRWQVALIFVGVILLGGLMVYLAEAYTIEREPAPGGTYVEGMVGSPQYVIPLLCQYNDVDHDLCALVFSGLLRFNVVSCNQIWRTAGRCHQTAWCTHSGYDRMRAGTTTGQ